MVAVNAELIKPDAPVIATVGKLPSKLAINCGAAVLLLPATSVDTAPATSRVTAPSAVGVTSTVYVEPEPLNALKVALPAVMSVTLNPVTSSLKVMVAVNAALIFPDAPVIATVGTVAS